MLINLINDDIIQIKIEVKTMKAKSLDKSIQNAAASVEMEGYKIDNQSKEWCKKLLQNEITMDEYINLVKLKAGVTV